MSDDRSLMQKMVLMSGDLDGGAGLGEMRLPDTGSLTVKGSALPGTLSAAGGGLVRFGGGYAAAVGASAAVSLSAGLPVVPAAAFTAGACVFHGGQRIADGWLWHRRGGRAAEKRRRRYQGPATPWEVRTRLSPRAAAAKMKRLAPELPAAQSFIPLGTTIHRPPQMVAVSRAETILVVGVPQSIKTALMSNWIMDAPGTVLATSSRGDQFAHTYLNRAALGEVLTLDADGHGPGTNFAWSPIAGCADPATAMRRAGDFMHASPRDTSGKDIWHEDRGAKLLRMALHAAALEGGNMFDVRAWVGNPEEETFLKAMRREDAAPGWADDLESLLVQGGDFLNSAIASAQSAIGWMDDPALAAVACPVEGGLDIAGFLRRGTGTIYLIGAKRPYGSLTPFFSAFASEFMEQARVLAETSPGRRLAVPLTVVADEAATTAKIDFERWCAVTAGYNITVIAGFQALSQIISGFGGAEAASTIRTMFSTKVIAGGMTDHLELEMLSSICGDMDTWRRGSGSRIVEKERVYPPERIRLLPDMHALVIHRNSRVVQVKIRPVWDHPLYQPVTIVPESQEQTAPA